MKNISLTELADRFNSDKGMLRAPHHGYTFVYEMLFHSLRDKPVSILELGLARTTEDYRGRSEERDCALSPSVEMWLRYFEQAHVTGFDLSDFSQHRDSRFTFIQGDLGKEADYDRILEGQAGFDIVVDDGSIDHTSEDLSRRFPDVKVVRLSGMGPGPARNAGVNAASGDVLMFLDSDEATREQLGFVSRVKKSFDLSTEQFEGLSTAEDLYEFRTEERIRSSYEHDFVIPDKFKHVDLEKVRQAEGYVAELKALLNKIHPWSSLHYGLGGVDTVVRLYLEWIPKYLGRDSEIQILSPMTRGSLGTANLNTVIQQAANPPWDDKPQMQVGERIFRVGDRVIHRRNNYDLEVFNGDIGTIKQIDTAELTCVVAFFPDSREVLYQKEDIVELDLAYAITIHKSQGSEFKAVILPVLTQHFKMLYRNLLYTGLTRARELAVIVGSRRAMVMAIRQQDTCNRQTALETLLREPQ